MFEILKRDAVRYEKLGGWYACPGFWIVAVYRFGNWAKSLPSPLLRIPFWGLYRVGRILQRALFSVDIWAGPRGARIGAGFCLIHPSNVMIGSAEIGEDCLIFHDVTFGSGPIPGMATVGKGVDVYVGARVLGGVVIGDGSMIGANCVVLRDIPPRSVVVPAQNRIIPRSLSVVANRGVHPAGTRPGSAAGAPEEESSVAADRAK